MGIKSIAAAVAIAFAATVGAASAADQFATLDGIAAATMTAGEMAVVRGAGDHDLMVHLDLTLGGPADPDVMSDGGLSTSGITVVQASKSAGLFKAADPSDPFDGVANNRPGSGPQTTPLHWCVHPACN